eukprot:13709999-Alexandrium_andersonii.AAC.1
MCIRDRPPPPTTPTSSSSNGDDGDWTVVASWCAGGASWSDGDGCGCSGTASETGQNALWAESVATRHPIAPERLTGMEAGHWLEDKELAAWHLGVETWHLLVGTGLAAWR